MLLDLVGLLFELRCDEETRDRLTREWPEFLARESERAPDVIVDARRVEALAEPVDSIEVIAERAGSDWRFMRRDFDLLWSPSRRTAKVSFRRGFSLTAALRTLLTMALRTAQGVLLHASSVRVGDAAVVFPGVSGTGKTTIAELGAPRGVLSDEITGVRIHGEAVVVHPTPFWGDMPRTRAADSAPLRALVFLERGGPPSIGPADPASVIATLLETVLLFNAQAASRDDKAEVVRLLTNIAMRSRCRRLIYALPANPWALLDDSTACVSAQATTAAS